MYFKCLPSLQNTPFDHETVHSYDVLEERRELDYSDMACSLTTLLLLPWKRGKFCQKDSLVTLITTRIQNWTLQPAQKNKKCNSCVRARACIYIYIYIYIYMYIYTYIYGG